MQVREPWGLIARVYLIEKEKNKQIFIASFMTSISAILRNYPSNKVCITYTYIHHST